MGVLDKVCFVKMLPQLAISAARWRDDSEQGVCPLSLLCGLAGELHGRSELRRCTRRPAPLRRGKRCFAGGYWSTFELPLVRLSPTLVLWRTKPAEVNCCQPIYLLLPAVGIGRGRGAGGGWGILRRRQSALLPPSGWWTPWKRGLTLAMRFWAPRYRR